MYSSKSIGQIKTKHLAGRLSRTILIGAFSVFMIFSFSSCARKISFSNSSVVPAATGKVKVKKDKNDNYRINVDIEHLAAPNSTATA